MIKQASQLEGKYKRTAELAPRIKRGETVTPARTFFYAPPQKPKTGKEVFVDSCDLPQVYQATHLTLMARDPFWIHAYWELGSSAVEGLRKTLGPEFDRSTHTLRVYDVTCLDFNGHNANNSFDIDFPPHAQNWYVNLWSDNSNYCAEIGMRTPDGRFFPMARSNFVYTPRASASGRSDMIWMDVRDTQSQPFVYSPSRARRIDSALQRSRDLLPALKNSPRKTYLSPADIRAYYSNLFPLYKRVRGKKNGNGNGDNGKKPALGYAEKDPRNAGFQRPASENILIPGLSRTDYYKKFLFGSSAELVSKGGASEQIFSGASVQPGGKGRKFFFELWTELLVYGRTEPDAEVKHGDKIIPLRKDGTFSLRFALPDSGKIPLDFVAISHDKVDSRRITTGVERYRTIYSP